MATTHRGTLSVAGRRRPAMTAQAGNAGVLNAAIAARARSSLRNSWTLWQAGRIPPGSKEGAALTRMISIV
jgi:hypothetical protein